jgi:hypothetical protein
MESGGRIDGPYFPDTVENYRNEGTKEEQIWTENWRGKISASGCYL